VSLEGKGGQGWLHLSTILASCVWLQQQPHTLPPPHSGEPPPPHSPPPPSTPHLSTVQTRYSPVGRWATCRDRRAGGITVGGSW
jgi:hypothetical protein